MDVLFFLYCICIFCIKQGRFFCFGFVLFLVFVHKRQNNLSIRNLGAKF